MKPRLLDLFCGAGGAAMGYHRAGFEVVGVDIKPQPHYPFPFIQADALTFMRGGGWQNRWGEADFSAIHASPPCQAHSALRSLHKGKDYPELIEPTRELLLDTGLPYVIENVVGAVLREPVLLCGSMVGARYRRHRLFETNWPLLVPSCAHGLQDELIGVYGNSDGAHVLGFKHPGVKRGPRQGTTKEIREAMEMPWAKRRREITEAVPPTFTELIGHQLMQHVNELRR